VVWKGKKEATRITGAKNRVALSDGSDVTVLRARMTVTALALSPCELIRRGVLIGPDKTI
jgi:hypothetical protein